MPAMRTSRLEAFSDGVLAIIITIMVLELQVPEEPTLRRARRLGDRLPDLPAELRLRRHLLEQPPPHVPASSSRSTAAVLWANLHLLFWLSLLPVHDGVDGRDRLRAGRRSSSTASTCSLAAIAYYVLQLAIFRGGRAAPGCAQALGATSRASSRRCSTSPASRWPSSTPGWRVAVFVVVAVIWLVPDRRVERFLAARGARPRH